MIRLGIKDLAEVKSDLEMASVTKVNSPGMWRTWRSIECLRRMLTEDFRMMLYV
jgi:hypothetical protein